MKIEQKIWTQERGWEGNAPLGDGIKFQLVLIFGDRLLLEDRHRFEELKAIYPAAHLVLASTAGNILGTSMIEEAIVSTALFFESKVEVQTHRVNIKETENSFLAGVELAKKISYKNLAHVLLLSDGHLVNGSELIKGVLSNWSSPAAVTGGLAGDGNRFLKTVVGLDAPPVEGEILAIAFYGSSLKVGFGSMGGWDPFGIERKITKSSGNILYELDGKLALDLYKKYLGEQANELPGSAMLFPLAIRQDSKSTPVVRTILSINEKDKSMVFAGDIPEGWYAQLMKANFDRLVDGALQAAHASHTMLHEQNAQLVLLISCFGRRLVLGPRTEEEIESVQEVMGKKAFMTGFYSYGEIAPTAPHANCELHNQTMTITTLTEQL